MQGTTNDRGINKNVDYSSVRGNFPDKYEYIQNGKRNDGQNKIRGKHRKSSRGETRLQRSARKYLRDEQFVEQYPALAAVLQESIQRESWEAGDTRPERTSSLSDDQAADQTKEAQALKDFSTLPLRYAEKLDILQKRYAQSQNIRNTIEFFHSVMKDRFNGTRSERSLATPMSFMRNLNMPSSILDSEKITGAQPLSLQNGGKHHENLAQSNIPLCNSSVTPLMYLNPTALRSNSDYAKSPTDDAIIAKLSPSRKTLAPKPSGFYINVKKGLDATLSHYASHALSICHENREINRMVDEVDHQNQYEIRKRSDIHPDLNDIHHEQREYILEQQRAIDEIKRDMSQVADEIQRVEKECCEAYYDTFYDPRVGDDKLRAQREKMKHMSFLRDSGGFDKVINCRFDAARTSDFERILIERHPVELNHARYPPRSKAEVEDFIKQWKRLPKPPYNPLNNEKYQACTQHNPSRQTKYAAIYPKSSYPDRGFVSAYRRRRYKEDYEKTSQLRKAKSEGVLGRYAKSYARVYEDQKYLSKLKGQKECNEELENIFRLSKEHKDILKLQQGEGTHYRDAKEKIEREAENLEHPIRKNTSRRHSSMESSYVQPSTLMYKSNDDAYSLGKAFLDISSQMNSTPNSRHARGKMGVLRSISVPAEDIAGGKNELSSRSSGNDVQGSDARSSSIPRRRIRLCRPSEHHEKLKWQIGRPEDSVMINNRNTSSSSSFEYFEQRIRKPPSRLQISALHPFERPSKLSHDIDSLSRLPTYECSDFVNLSAPVASQQNIEAQFEALKQILQKRQLGLSTQAQAVYNFCFACCTPSAASLRDAQKYLKLLCEVLPYYPLQQNLQKAGVIGIVNLFQGLDDGSNALTEVLNCLTTQLISQEGQIQDDAIAALAVVVTPATILNSLVVDALIKKLEEQSTHRKTAEYSIHILSTSRMPHRRARQYQLVVSALSKWRHERSILLQALLAIKTYAAVARIESLQSSTVHPTSDRRRPISQDQALPFMQFAATVSLGLGEEWICGSFPDDVKQVIAILLTNSEDRKVYGAATMALSSLIKVSENHCQMIASLGIEEVLQGLSKYSDSATVASNNLAVLLVLALKPEYRQLLMTQHGKQKNLLPTAFHVVRSHQENQSVITNAFAFLAAIADTGAVLTAAELMDPLLVAIIRQQASQDLSTLNVGLNLSRYICAAVMRLRKADITPQQLQKFCKDVLPLPFNTLEKSRHPLACQLACRALNLILKDALQDISLEEKTYWSKETSTMIQRLFHILLRYKATAHSGLLCEALTAVANGSLHKQSREEVASKGIEVALKVMKACHWELECAAQCCRCIAVFGIDRKDIFEHAVQRCESLIDSVATDFSSKRAGVGFDVVSFLHQMLVQDWDRVGYTDGKLCPAASEQQNED